MAQKKFDVIGMSCSACSAAVSRAVSELEGVQSVSVSLLGNSMSVECAADVDSAVIIKAVEQAGYHASVALSGSMRAREIARQAYQKIRKRMIWSIFFTLPLFYISMGHMMGWPIPSVLHQGNRGALLFAFTQMVLCLPVLIVNIEFFCDGIKALFRRAPNMNTLICIGAGASVVYSVCMTGTMLLDYVNRSVFIDRTMDLYFESAAMIFTLITVGKTLEMRARRRTSDAISKLMDLTPKTASVERDGKEVRVFTEEIGIGEWVWVRSGETVPVDGIIESGCCSVDESAITGESLPADRKEGDELVAASILRSGFVRMRAQKVGEDTTLAQIIRLVEEASSSKAPISRLADRVSGIFVPIVMCIAVVTGLIWWIAGETGAFALRCAISVLVISCPCALGLATPTAIMAGVGRGASLGILIKSAQALETLHQIDTVVLDKTGTITQGKMRVTDLAPDQKIGKGELLRLAASLESASSHPIALAITEEARRHHVVFDVPSQYEEIAGGGIRGVLRSGELLVGGNLSLMKELGVMCSDFMEQQAQKFALEGKTPLIFVQFQTENDTENTTLSHRMLGMIAVADTIKESSAEAVLLLQESQIEVMMLTGDQATTAHAIAAQIGIAPQQVISGVRPQEKDAKVADLQRSGRCVAMVGDGINDAPALMRADVGLAVGAGTDIAIESADIVLLGGDLREVVSAVSLSGAVIRNIKQNLTWAFLYNVAGIPIAAGLLYPLWGIGLDPMYAAAAMSLSSFCVVSNALRLRKFVPGKIKRRSRRARE